MTPGNIHDSQILQPLVEMVMEKVKKTLVVATDAAYKTPAITKFLYELDMQRALPYTRPKTKDGFLRKHEYVYDEYYHCYLCAEEQVLKYSPTTKDGKRQYKLNPTQCENCLLHASKDHRKIIERHIWAYHVEEADYLRHQNDIKQIYASRKETFERFFADAKQKHGKRRTTILGIKKLSMQTMLTFAAMNLKKLANWTWHAR